MNHSLMDQTLADAPVEPGPAQQPPTSPDGWTPIACLGCLLIPIVVVLGSCVLLVNQICQQTWQDVRSPDGAYVAVAAATYCDLGATGHGGGISVSLRGPQNWLGKAEEVSLLEIPRVYQWNGTGRLWWEDARTLWVAYRNPPVEAPDIWKDVQIR
jgi:hypothetical protein